MKITVTQEVNVPSGFYCNKKTHCNRLVSYENSKRCFCSLFNVNLQVTSIGFKKCEKCLLLYLKHCGDE